MKKDKLLILLTFMFVFAFKIYSIIDSTIIVGGILTAILFINRGYRKKIYDMICNKYTYILIICFLTLIVWSIGTTLINNVRDFTYLKTLFHLCIVIAIGYELIAYIDYKNKKSKILNYVIISFLIQSSLQWFFFLFPSVSKIFNIFRTEGMILNNIKYAGYRGLAISSSGFFGLSSAYGLISILYFTKYNTLFKNNTVKILMFLLMFSGTFFAGRTGFVALPFIFILLMVKAIKNRKEIKRKINKKTILISIMCLIFIILLYVITFKIPKFAQMYSYAFELFENIFSGDGFTTTSTDKLIAMYNREISPKTFIIGDGKYTDKNSYYMNTDVGYLRKIFYFGILGTIMSFILQAILLIKKKNDLYNYLIFLFLIVLELKGEIIGISIIINSIILLYSNTSNINEKEQEDG